MNRQASSLCIAMLMVMVVALGVVETAADGIDAEVVPRTCTLDDGIGYGRVDVEVCPGSSSCPLFAPCSRGGGTCAIWPYEFRWRDDHPHRVAISVSADVKVRSTTPQAHVTPLGERVRKFGVGKNQFGRRWLSFETDSRRHTVTIETPSEFGAGVAGTAAAKGERIKEFCLILAPGARVTQPFEAQTVMVMDELACGTVRRVVDPQGSTISFEAPETCEISRTQLTNTEGDPVLFVDPRVRITFEGSTKQCYRLENNELICFTAP